MSLFKPYDSVKIDFRSKMSIKQNIAKNSIYYGNVVYVLKGFPTEYLINIPGAFNNFIPTKAFIKNGKKFYRIKEKFLSICLHREERLIELLDTDEY